ncbi:MAG: DUF6134 family protein [Caulobacteraceae bacterium]
MIRGCIALICCGFSPAAAGESPQTYSYALTHPLYGDIGSYRRASDEADGVIHARSHLEVAVRILGLVVHRETADQTEAWRGGRLLSFQSLNITNGRRLSVSGQADGARFLVTSPSGVAVAPGDVVASDPWSLTRTGAGVVVSTRTGQIDAVQVTGGEPEILLLKGTAVQVRHFHVNTAARPNKWEVWIDRGGLPIKFRSLESGAAIDFTLASSSPSPSEASVPPGRE